MEPGVGDESRDLYDFVGDSRLGWFTAYLANVFLTKLQSQILPRKSRDRIKPNGAF